MTPRLGRASGVLALWLVASSALAQQVSPPSAKDSVLFLAIGDTGTGDRAQYEVAAQVAKAHATFPFTFAIMMGDNMYGTNGRKTTRRSSRSRTNHCSTRRSNSTQRSATTTTRTSGSTSRST